jgi:hypothetical protein
VQELYQKLLDKKIASNGLVGTVGDLWKRENAKFKVKKQDKLILILRFYLKIKKTWNSAGSTKLQTPEICAATGIWIDWGWGLSVKL